MECAEYRQTITAEEFFKFTATTPDGEHWELWRGVPRCSPAPGQTHALISVEMGAQLLSFFRGRTCSVMNPRDVKLEFDGKPVVYEPDLLVLCDLSKDDGNVIHGAPDLVVEIWSPGNSAKERFRKRQDYRQAGAREIWEVYPEKRVVHLTTQDPEGDDGYIDGIYGFDEVIPSTLFPGLTVDLSLY